MICKHGLACQFLRADARREVPPAPERISAVKDASIDFSDVPERDESFRGRAEVVEPDRTGQVTISSVVSIPRTIVGRHSVDSLARSESACPPSWAARGGASTGPRKDPLYAVAHSRHASSRSSSLGRLAFLGHEARFLLTWRRLPSPAFGRGAGSFAVLPTRMALRARAACKYGASLAEGDRDLRPGLGCESSEACRNGRVPRCSLVPPRSVALGPLEAAVWTRTITDPAPDGSGLSRVALRPTVRPKSVSVPGISQR